MPIGMLWRKISPRTGDGPRGALAYCTIHPPTPSIDSIDLRTCKRPVWDTPDGPEGHREASRQSSLLRRAVPSSPAGERHQGMQYKSEIAVHNPGRGLAAVCDLAVGRGSGANSTDLRSLPTALLRQNEE